VTGADAGPQAPGQEAEAPSSFQILCGSLVAQVQMALGLFPDPVDKQTRVEIGAAKQGIDMLVMLEEKTKGNLDAREAKFLTMLLTQLRMLFVDRVKELSQSDSPEQPEGRVEGQPEGRVEGQPAGPVEGQPEGPVEGQPAGESDTAPSSEDGPTIVTP
jgi:hypothetical protein